MRKTSSSQRAGRTRPAKLAVLVFAAIIVTAALLTVLLPRLDLGTVVRSLETENGTTLLLSHDRRGICLSFLGQDGRIHETRRLQNPESGCVLLPDYMSILPSGNVYFNMYRVHLESNLIIGEAVYLAPPDGGLTPVYQLEHPLSDRVRRTRIFDLRTYEDELLFFQRDGHTERVMVLTLGSLGEIEWRNDMNIPLNSLGVRYAEPNTTVYSLPDSTIWISVAGAEAKLVYAAEPRPGGEHVLSRLWQDHEENIYFSLISGECFQIDLATGQYAPHEEMVASGPYGSRYPLAWPLLLRRFGLLLALAAAVAAAAGLMALMRRLLRGRLTVAAKQALALIPAIGIGVAVNYWLFNSYLTQSYHSQAYQALFSLGAARAAEMDTGALSGIHWDAPLQDPEYLRLSQAFQSVYTPPSRSVSVGGEPLFEYQSYTYQYLYVVCDGALYTAVGDTYIGCPIDRLRSHSELLSRMPDLLREDSSLYGKLNASDGQWQVVLLPVYDKQGAVVAVIECGVSDDAVQASVNTGMRRIAWMLVLFAASLTLVMLVVVIRSFYRLRTLQETVSLVGQGQYGLQADVRGNDEIARIADVFNAVSVKTQETMDILNHINQAYFRFVPEKLLDLIGCPDIRKAEPGDQTIRSVAMLLVRAGEDRASGAGAPLTVQAYNELFTILVPFVTEHGGVIERYQGRGFLALFEAAYEAGAAALQIAGACEDRRIVPSMTLHQTEVTLGIMGVEGRLEARVVSDQVDWLERLGGLAERLDCRLIVTARAKEGILERSPRCGIRRLGFARRSEEEVEIFEVYQADSHLKRGGKAAGLEIYHKSLDLYSQRRYKEARRLLIETLRGFGGDGAARVYLELCEHRVADPDASDGIWLRV